MKLYTLALADSNFFEAWQYQRSFNESDEMRPRLFNALLEWCITRQLFVFLFLIVLTLL